MKKLVPDYIFDASTKTVELKGININLKLEQILLITNVTRNKIIYNFTSSGGSITDNVLSLIYDTTQMADTDALQIYVDYPEERVVRGIWEGETIFYKGWAVVGSLPSEPKWKICKMEIDTNGSFIEKWADGDAEEDNIWDNRNSLTYM